MLLRTISGFELSRSVHEQWDVRMLVTKGGTASKPGKLPILALIPKPVRLGPCLSTEADYAVLAGFLTLGSPWLPKTSKSKVLPNLNLGRVLQRSRARARHQRPNPPTVFVTGRLTEDP